MKYRVSMLIVAVVLCVAAAGCQPDLEVDLTANGSYAEGESVAGTVDIKVWNSGNYAAAPGTADADEDGYMVDLVLSADAAAPVAFAVVPTPYAFAEDMLIEGGRVSNTETLASGASKVYSGHGGAIPPGTPATAYLCAVVDPGGKVAESDEGNNTSCVEVKITPAENCVTFETPALGTQYGQPVPHAPGDLVLTAGGIEVRVQNFTWPSGGTFNHAEIQASTAAFGVDSQFAFMNNINFEMDFTGLPFEPSKVTFEFRNFGGFDNISINGDPSPIYVGPLTGAPPNMGGVMFSTGPSTATLTGPVKKLWVGGQELGIDQVCAWP